MFKLSFDKIDREKLIEKITNIHAGALVTFEGWVRDHNEGKKVSSLEYQVYEELAVVEGEKILSEAKLKFNLHHIECVHRYGHLDLGDTAIWIGATATHRDDAYKASRFIIDQIKFRLPIWKKEHYVIEEAKWVFCKDHHTHVHFDEDEYYQKQAKLVDQDKLRSSRVLVVGAGGLGCPVLQSLVSAGVGEIEVVDFDTISISNIHRQVLYSPEVVGEKKVTIAVNKLMDLNPFIKIKGIDTFVDESNVIELTKSKDIVIDCTDNLSVKFLLHDACFKNRTPLISASIYKYDGQVRTFVPNDTFGCLRCSYEETPSDSKIGNCNDSGVLGCSVSIIGSIQASETLLFLNNKTNNTVKDTLLLDLKSLSQFKIKNFKKEECNVCNGIVDISENSLEITVENANEVGAVLVDIRGREDIFIEKFLEHDGVVALYCHKGFRSGEIVSSLRRRGYSHFFSVKGGARSL